MGFFDIFSNKSKQKELYKIVINEALDEIRASQNIYDVSKAKCVSFSQAKIICMQAYKHQMSNDDFVGYSLNIINFIYGSTYSRQRIE